MRFNLVGPSKRPDWRSRITQFLRLARTCEGRGHRYQPPLSGRTCSRCTHQRPLVILDEVSEMTQEMCDAVTSTDRSAIPRTAYIATDPHDIERLFPLVLHCPESVSDPREETQ